MSSNNTSGNNKVSKKTKLSLGRPAIIAAAVVAALVVLYVIFGIYFSNHFYIGSTVNGVPTSFKSAEAAYNKIRESAKDYSLTIENDGETLATFTGDDLGLVVDCNEADVADILKEQNGFLWVSKLFASKDYVTANSNTYDSACVEDAATSLSSLETSNGTESQDAYIEFDGEKFVVVPEVVGTNITHESIVEAIQNALENLSDTLEVEDGDVYARPATQSDDKDINAAVETLNKYMEVSINYDLGEGLTDSIPTDTMATFFKWDEDFNVDFDQDAIGAFVNEMGDKYDTYGKAKHLVTTSGEEVDVPCGSYGWKIAYQGEIDAIIADLTAGEDVTRDFTYLYTAASHGENDYGDSYVEVNLTDQMVYVYKEGELVVTSKCVSGNISASHGTHTGAYPIAYKEKDATLKGANYESHVKYWMPFNMGEGLHDASWRSSFGGTIFETSGSHGCVNLPTSSAKEIFEVVDAGWPVLVFYTGNSEAEIYAANNPVTRVETEIAELETITLDSAVALINARTDYDNLSDEEKAQVTNLDVLEAAELQYQLLLIENGMSNTDTIQDTQVTNE